MGGLLTQRGGEEAWWASHNRRSSSERPSRRRSRDDPCSLSVDQAIGTGEVMLDLIPCSISKREGQLPPWTCTLIITATVSSTPDSFTVQVADLTAFTCNCRSEWPVHGDCALCHRAHAGHNCAPGSHRRQLPSLKNGSTSTTVFEVMVTSSTVVP